MWFNILTHNHAGLRAIEALAPNFGYLRQMLSACGHEVSLVHDQLYPEAVNLYLEHFMDGARQAGAFAAWRRDHGVRIGVVATELMVQGTIPYARHGISNTSSEDLARRMQGFEAVLREVDFLWSWLERTAIEYKGRVGVSEFMPVGSISPVPAELRRSPKDIDVVFFGKLTPHRANVLQSLIDSGIKVVAAGVGFPMGKLPEVLLASLLDRARIGLNLTLHAEDDAPYGTDPRFVSCMRVVEMLSREVLVVSETIPLDNPYAAFMESAPPKDLPALCRSLLVEGRHAERAQANAAAFQTAMDVRTTCAPVIDRTLAALALGG